MMNDHDRQRARERQQRRRQRLKDRGVQQYSLYAHPHDWPRIRALAKRLADQRDT